MDRPFIAYKIGELEEAFAERHGDRGFLELLTVELSHRGTPRATELMAVARSHLDTLSAKPSEPPIPASLPQSPAAQPASAPPTIDIPVLVPPQPAASNTPQAVLDAWTALEVLSPQSYRQPEDLAGGDKQAVAGLDQARLPWEAGGEHSRKNFRLYYQIVLGSLRLEETVKRILDVYVDKRVERPATRGSAAMAVVVVDQQGRPVEAPAVGLSSFGWGVPNALAGRLDQLAGWPAAEAKLLKVLEQKVRRTDEDGNELPLTRAVLSEVYEWLVTTLGLPADLVEAPAFAIRSFQYFKQPDPPDPLLLNSFFLGDLGKARDAFLADRATPNLRRYLGVDRPASRKNLLHDTEALENAVAPALTPLARWPGKGRHPLVLLQQAAVNSAIDTLRSDGILAVNGPPGTGKTTLLRDLVAALVTARAEVMTKFDDPQEAFTHSGEKVKAGQAWLHLYNVDKRLKGFEILVASSNNKAVENVSAELPGVEALAQDAGLRYFSCLSDALHDPKKTWGLIAAVLGNAANRNKFRQTFWWDDDVGLSTYLAAAAGTPQVIEEKDPKTGGVFERPPRIIVEENPPANRAEALGRWRQARTEFSAILKASRDQLKDLEKVRQAVRDLPVAEQREISASKVLATARVSLTAAKTAHDSAETVAAAANAALSASREKLKNHDLRRPGFLARLLGLAAARQWQTQHYPLATAEHAALATHDEAQRKRAACEQTYRSQSAAHLQAERDLQVAALAHSNARATVDAARVKLKPTSMADQNFFAQPHAELHKATPWLDLATQRARDDLFVAAMRLHKAFIDAAAKPLRHNLGNLMNIFSGRAMPDEAKCRRDPGQRRLVRGGQQGVMAEGRGIPEAG